MNYSIKRDTTAPTDGRNLTESEQKWSIVLKVFHKGKKLALILWVNMLYKDSVSKTTLSCAETLVLTLRQIELAFVVVFGQGLWSKYNCKSENARRGCDIWFWTLWAYFLPKVSLIITHRYNLKINIPCRAVRSSLRAITLDMIVTFRTNTISVPSIWLMIMISKHLVNGHYISLKSW